MKHDAYSDDDIAQLLSSIKTFAVIGASANPVRPSFIVMKYLLGKGYDVRPVNPGLAGQEVLGRAVHARLADVSGAIDCVDIFRNSDAAFEIVREAIAHKDRLGLKFVWMQLGVRNDQAASEAETAGLQVVMNRCPKIEFGRLSGEIGWAGVNSGIISNKRPVLAPLGVQSHILARKP